MTSTALATLAPATLDAVADARRSLDLANATGDELAAAWLATKRSENTRAAYRTDLLAFVAWCDRVGLPPLAATVEVINAYRLDLEGSDLAASTVARRLASLSSFFGFVARRGLIARNPVDWRDVPRPKVADDSPTLGMELDEAGRFLAAAAKRGARDEALACLLVLNGLRVSEALSIDLDDVADERGHRFVRVVGKGGRTRTVPLSPRTLDAMTRAAQGRTSGPVIVNRYGHRLTRRGAGRIVAAIAADAGLSDKITPHSCRHTFVTLALAAGQPLHRVQDDAGHASPLMTQRYNRQRERLDNASTYVLSAQIGGQG